MHINILWSLRSSKLETLRTLAGLLVCAGLLMPIPVSAANIAGFIGGTAGPDTSGYIGAMAALPGFELGDGPAIRLTGYTSRYAYNNSLGTQIKGDDTGVDIFGLYQFSGDWGYANFGGGARYTDTTLTPVDLGNDRRGRSWDGAVAADGSLRNGPWRVDWYGQYGFDRESYLVRGGITYPLDLGSGRLRLGGEASGDGDKFYSRGMFGPLVIVALDENVELRVTGGAVVQSSRNTEPFVSIALSGAI